MTSDKAILKAFKNARSKPSSNDTSARDTSLDTALKTLRTDGARKAFSGLHNFLLQNTTDTDVELPVDDLAVLVASRLPASAEFVFCDMVALLATWELDKVLPLASTPKCIQTWIAARAASFVTSEADERSIVREHALGNTDLAVHSVLAHWFILTASHEDLPKAAEFFTARPSTGWFASREDLLVAAVKRDTSGAFSSRHLLHCAQDRDALTADLALMRANPEIFDELVRLFPLVLESDSTGTITNMLPELFADLPRSSGAARRLLSARLTRLAASLLAKPPARHVNDALRTLDSISQSLASVIPVGDTDTDACGIRYHGQNQNPDGPRVSIEGAKLIAIAIQNVREGTDALGTLDATAFNLGMRPIGTSGEVIKFDPIHHQDTVGGALPGNEIVVIQHGLLLGSQIIERAKVKKV